MKFTDMVFGYIRQSYLSPLSFGRPTHPHIAPPKHSYIHRLSARLNSPNLHFLAASGWGCCQLWRSNKCSDWGHPLCSYSPAFHLLLRETRNTDVSGRSEHHCSSAATRAQRSRCAVNHDPEDCGLAAFDWRGWGGRWGRDADLRLAAILEVCALSCSLLSQEVCKN